MRQLLVILLSFVSISVFAANKVSVCSQLHNKTGHAFNYLVQGQTYSLKPRTSSPVAELPDAAKYQFLNGEITVYAGMPQITSNGDFNMMFENGVIPASRNCIVYYNIFIFE